MATKQQVKTWQSMRKALGESTKHEWTIDDNSSKELSSEIDAMLDKAGANSIREFFELNKKVKTEVHYPKANGGLTPPEFGMIWKEYRADLRAGLGGDFPAMVEEVKKLRAQYCGEESSP